MGVPWITQASSTAYTHDFLISPWPPNTDFMVAWIITEWKALLKSWKVRVDLISYLKVGSDPDDGDEQTAFGLVGNGGRLQVGDDPIEQGDQKIPAFGREESAKRRMDIWKTKFTFWCNWSQPGTLAFLGVEETLSRKFKLSPFPLMIHSFEKNEETYLLLVFLIGPTGRDKEISSTHKQQVLPQQAWFQLVNYGFANDGPTWLACFFVHQSSG